MRIVLTAALLLLAATPAAAQNGSTAGALELYPTLQAIGARLAYTGDVNQNATAHLEWRLAGGTWKTGMNMTRITNSRWAASVLWLAENTQYEVRAVITDPDGGGSTSGTVKTRAVPSRTPTGRTLWVSTNGSDSWPGTASQPFATIQAAANIVNAGDEIRVRPGIYYQFLDTSRGGSATALVHLTADAPGVILDGSDPAYLNRNDWRSDGGGIYSLPFTGTTRVVCVDSLMRLYNQANLAALQTNALGVSQGFTVDTGRLYVKLEGGLSPNGHKVHVARYNVGMFIDNSYWHVSGFEVRYFGTGSGGSGIYMTGANGCWIENNHVHTMGGKPIYLRSMASDCLIENNVCRDPRIYSWPWDATKGHNEENAAISQRGGRGVVIRYNICQGTTDGVDTGGDDGATENIGVDLDIHDNTITLMGDDALEPETTSGINVRVWHNRVDNVFSGCSIAPNTVGPTYVLYNTITNYKRGGFKFSLSGTAQIWICHNTVTSIVPGAPAVHPSGPYSNIHFRNNILVGNGSASVSDDAGESQTGNDYDSDLIYSNYPALFRWKGVNYSTLSALRSGTGFEMLGRAGDPLFVAPGNGDYMPGPASPAIDGGIRLPGINDAYNGAAPDIGAIEYGIPGVDVVPPAAIRDLN
jgi:parallel beta-helix repeat protein